MRQGTTYEMSEAPIKGAREALERIADDCGLRQAAKFTQRAAICAQDARSRIGTGDFYGADLTALAAFDAASYAQAAAARTLEIADQELEAAADLLEKTRNHVQKESRES